MTDAANEAIILRAADAIRARRTVAAVAPPLPPLSAAEEAAFAAQGAIAEAHIAEVRIEREKARRQTIENLKRLLRADPRGDDRPRMPTNTSRVDSNAEAAFYNARLDGESAPWRCSECRTATFKVWRGGQALFCGRCYAAHRLSCDDCHAKDALSTHCGDGLWRCDSCLPAYEAAYRADPERYGKPQAVVGFPMTRHYQ